ncbi:hypothetical protein STEG23_022445, partial [Scotinomys teguina]
AVGQGCFITATEMKLGQCAVHDSEWKQKSNQVEPFESADFNHLGSTTMLLLRCSCEK